MSLHAFHFNWLWDATEIRFILGFATGRVSYEPAARWLYSFRVFLGVAKVEILWRTGLPQKRTCNRHLDCDKADAQAKAQGRTTDHCNDPCCEDCFGQ